MQQDQLAGMGSGATAIELCLKGLEALHVHLDGSFDSAVLFRAARKHLEDQKELALRCIHLCLWFFLMAFDNRC